MKLVKLERNQIINIYHERMGNDFPQDELRPLNMLLASLDKGEYECLGLMDDETLKGYVYMIKHGDDYLVDYLATVPSNRNQGLGTAMLKLLSDYLDSAASIIGEVENPDFAYDEDTRNLQTRRRNFYYRNGFRDTGVRVTCFGVPFVIIETGNNLIHSEREIEELYLMHYGKVLPQNLFDENIVINK